MAQDRNPRTGAEAVASPWKSLDRGGTRYRPAALIPGDEGYFVHEYRVGGPAERNPSKALILDFKADPTQPGYARRKPWKEEAARSFARDLAEILPRGARACAVPPSKRRDDPEYDPRFEMLFDCLAACRVDVRIERPFSVAGSRRAAHAGGPRSRSRYYEQLRWEGLAGGEAGPLFVVDDVITTGVHFKACQQLLREHGVGRPVGLFWSLACRPVGRF